MALGSRPSKDGQRRELAPDTEGGFGPGAWAGQKGIEARYEQDCGPYLALIFHFRDNPPSSSPGPQCMLPARVRVLPIDWLAAVISLETGANRPFRSTLWAECSRTCEKVVGYGHAGVGAGVAAQCTVTTMTDWPAEWRPVNPDEAQKYLDAHQDGTGDPELIEECQSLLDLDRQQSLPPPTGRTGGATPEWDLPELPEELTEEKGAD